MKQLFDMSSGSGAHWIFDIAFQARRIGCLRGSEDGGMAEQSGGQGGERVEFIALGAERRRWGLSTFEGEGGWPGF